MATKPVLRSKQFIQSVRADIFINVCEQHLSQYQDLTIGTDPYPIPNKTIVYSCNT